MANEAKRHHTVPRFYLDGFAQEGQLVTVRLPGTKRFRQSTRNASLRTEFYTIPELEEPDAFEKGLSDIESDAAAALRTIVSDGIWPLDPDTRTKFAIFLAVQFLRGPDQRRSMEQISAIATQVEIGVGGRKSVESWAAAKRGVNLTSEQADRLWAAAIQPGGPPMKLTARAHIEQINVALPQILKYFRGRPWRLVRFSRRSLLTGDTPVAVLPDPRAPGEPVGLLATPGITFPLTRKVGLVLGSAEPYIERVPVEDIWEGRLDVTLPPSTDYANLINTATVNNTREWLFHHPDDTGLVSRDLPQPRTIEILADLPDFGGPSPSG